MMVPGNVNDSAVLTAEPSIWWWGHFLKSTNHLHSFVCVEFQVIETAPEHQLIDLSIVPGLIVFVDETNQSGVACIRE